MLPVRSNVTHSGGVTTADVISQRSLVLPHLLFTLGVVTTLVACQTAPRSEALTVTVSEGTQLVASLSPDGNTIALILLGKIWVVDRDGGAAVALTDPAHDLSEYGSIAWAPDSRRLVARTLIADQPGLYVIDIESRTLQHISDRIDVAQPVWTPDGASIVGASIPVGPIADSTGLWMFPPDGRGEAEHLVKLRGNGGLVAYAPGGDTLAFVSPVTFAGFGHRSNWRSDIWEVDLLSGDQRQLTADSIHDAHPAYSPDGQWIAFISERSGSVQVWLLPRAGGEARQLTHAEDAYANPLSWLPDSRGVVYTAAGKIWVAWIDGTPASTIEFQVDLPVRRWQGLRRPEIARPGQLKRVRGIVTPELSPNGQRVAFAALGDLWVGGVEGGAPRRLTETPDDEYIPRWSPDGERLLYQAQPVGGAMEARVLEVGGTGTPRPVAVPHSDFELQFAWSPDGQRIAYVADNTVGWVDLAGTDGKVVVQAPATLVGWTPDGAWIVYTTGRWERFGDYTNELWRVAVADSGRVEPFPVSEEYLLRAAWTSDLSRTAYVIAGRGYHAPVDASTEVAVALTDPSPRYFSWSADGRYLLYLSDARLRLYDTESSESRTLDLAPEYVVSASPPPLLIRNTVVIDGTGRPPRGPFDVLIAEGRIERIAQPGEIEERAGVQEIEAAGRTLVPGLFDTHTHRQLENASRLAGYVYNGVLSVRDVGTAGEWQQSQRERVEAGELLAPRLFMSAGMVQRDVHQAAMSTQAAMYAREVDPEDPVSVAGEIRSLLAVGADVVKIRIRDSPLDARVAEASHAVGLPVTSHYVFASTLARGLEGKEHSNLHYRGSTALYREDVIALLRAGDVCVTPTLMTYYVLRLGGQSALFPVDLNSDPPHAGILAPRALSFARRFLGRRLSERSRRAWETWFGWDLANVQRLHEAGVRIATGTDVPSPWGEVIQLEMEALVKAGFTPLEAIRAATFDAASCIGVEHELGSVEEGKLADLIIVDGDPASDITDMRRVAWIIRGGKPYTRDEVSQWVREISR